MDCAQKKVLKVSKEFISAFDFCMNYYGVTGKELDYEKQRIRDNYEEAQQCYLDIARGHGHDPRMVKKVA